MSFTTKTPRHQEEKRKLPNGWRWVKLGEVCELNPRRPLIDRKDSAPTSFIPMEAVDAISGVVSDLPVRPYGEVKKGYTYFAEGDVIFAKITPCMQNGKHAVAVGLIDGIGFGTTEFHVLRPSKGIISELIWFFVRQPSVLIEATEHFTGAVGQQRLPQKYLANLETPLPPLAEQRRIAGVLRKQMAAVEKARAAAQARLAAVKDLPAAFLSQIFPQPGQPLPNGWRWVTLGQFIGETRNGFGRRPQVGEHGPVVLRLADVSNGFIDLSNARRGFMSEVEVNTYRVKCGDLLFVRVNGSPDYIGKCIPVESDDDIVCFNDHLIRVRVKAELLPAYLSLICRAPAARTHFIESASTSAGQLTINRESLDSFVLPLPPLSEQRRMAAVLREQMAAVEKARAAAEAELNTINALPAALLRRAFNGEI